MSGPFVVWPRRGGWRGTERGRRWERLRAGETEVTIVPGPALADEWRDAGRGPGGGSPGAGGGEKPP